MNGKMSYDDFKNAVASEIRDFLPPSYKNWEISLKTMYKVNFALCVSAFSCIGSDACAASKYLICYNVFVFHLDKVSVHIDYTCRKGLGLS